MRQHRPIDKPEQRGGLRKRNEALKTDVLEEAVPGDLAQGGQIAEHDFSIDELQRVGVSGLCERDHFGTGRERLKDGVDGRASQIAEVGYGETKGGEGVSHDGPVAAELLLFDDEFKIAGVAGGERDFFAEGADGGEPFVRGGGRSLVDDIDDLVDEAVEADDDALVGERSRCKASGGGVADGFARSHGNSRIAV